MNFRSHFISFSSHFISFLLIRIISIIYCILANSFYIRKAHISIKNISKKSFEFFIPHALYYCQFFFLSFTCFNFLVFYLKNLLNIFLEKIIIGGQINSKFVLRIIQISPCLKNYYDCSLF